MTNENTLQKVGKRRRYARVDTETLVELTFLLDRVTDTLGTIAPALALAKNRNATEKKTPSSSGCGPGVPWTACA